MSEDTADIDALLAHIWKRQAQPGGTGNPEGYTEMHTFHVWEVLNALAETRPTPPAATQGESA